MSEEVKKPKAKKSSSTPKKATSKKKEPANKTTTTRKTTTKKVAKKEVEQDLNIVTPGEEIQESIITEMPTYVEPTIEETNISIESEVPVYQDAASVEEYNMNNEENREIKNEETVDIQIPQEVNTVEPEVQVFEPPVYEEPVNNYHTEPVNEGYKATRISNNNPVVEEPITVAEPTSFAYEESPVEKVISVETPVASEEYPTYQETYPEPVEPIINNEVEMPVESEPVYTEQVQTEEKVLVKAPKKKADIKTILLVILFVFLFAFIMGMPYVNEFLDTLKKDAGLSEIERQAKAIEKEQQKENPKYKETDDGEIVKDKLTKLTCRLATTSLEDYDLTVVETFTYNSKGQVLESTKTNIYGFTGPSDAYDGLKTQCTENSLKYVENKGYSIACSYNDTEINITDEFDLSTFTTINDGLTKIEANAKYKEKIDKVKERMTAANYVCE